MPSKAPKQARFLKSQQDLKAKAEAVGDDDEEEDGKTYNIIALKVCPALTEHS